MLDGLHHEALPYDAHGGFTAACREIVSGGIDRDERMIVMASEARLHELSVELGPDTADVALVSLDEHGRNPGRLATLLATFLYGGDDRRCLGVSESVSATRSPAALAEAQLTEFVLNDDRVAVWPLTLVCLYDTGALPSGALDVMSQSHPVVRGIEANSAYLPGHAAALLAGELDPAPAHAYRAGVAGVELARLRDLVRGQAAAAGLTGDRVDDLVLAANEIVTNSIRYGGGHADVALWSTSEGVVCEVRDAGVVTDPLIGRLAPEPASASGRGVWLANQLCDLVQLRSSPLGTTVRLHVER